MPTVSSDGLTVTFTVPAGKYKFNTGEPVTAQTFADSLMRDLNPKQVSPFVSFVGSSIEGATGWNGKGTIPGVQVSGRSADPAPDEAERHDRGRDGDAVHVRDPARTRPINSKGVTSIAGAGPYYIASYKPNQSLVVKKNPNYTGSSSAPDQRDRLQPVHDRSEPGAARDQERPAGLVPGLRDGSPVAAALPAVRRRQPCCRVRQAADVHLTDDRGELLRHEHGEQDVRRTRWSARRSTTRSTARA